MPYLKVSSQHYVQIITILILKPSKDPTQVELYRSSSLFNGDFKISAKTQFSCFTFGIKITHASQTCFMPEY